MVFQNLRAIGRYNETEYSIPQLVGYINKYMNLTLYEMANHCRDKQNISDYKLCQNSIYQTRDDDELGPIPLNLQESTDWLLIFSFVFLIFVVFFRYRKR